MGNWLDLAAPYFEAVGRDVFEAYLNGHGFGRGRAGDTGALAYRRGRCLLEVDYYVEDSPNYSPMLNIGHVRRSFLRAHFAGIGLWYAVPEGAEAREYGSWRFSDAVGLKNVLTRIRDEVVEVYARPLWDNPEELARLIDQRLAQVESERRHEAVSRKKAEAEQAFRSRDYHKAAPLHGQLDESQLSLIDRKRDAFSKKRAS